MKKKFTKERFYKRRAYQLMVAIQGSFEQAQRMINDARNFNEAVIALQQREYEQQQTELANGTAVIIPVDRKHNQLSKDARDQLNSLIS